MSRPADALRLALLAALGAPACRTEVVDPDDTSDTTDTGEVDTGDTEDTADSGDSGDTGDSSDTGDTSDTSDTSDTGDTADTSDTEDTGRDTDTDTDTCGDGAPDAQAEWNANGWLSWGRYTLCLDASVPHGDAGCSGQADLWGRLDDIMTPDCLYSDSDTGFFPIPTNPPCDDGTVFLDSTTCGPFEGPGGTCCFEVMLSQVAIGRPLVLDGTARTAMPGAVAGWSVGQGGLDVPDDLRDAVRDGWLDVARAEHASVASFARVALDLLAHGAPAGLVADATTAQADEIRHAQAAFDIAHRIDGAPWGPGPLDLSDLTVRATLEEVLVASIVEGCVGETVAAHEAAVAATRTRDPRLADTLRTIADDEARHAALGWRIARWVLDRRPDLSDLARRTLDDAVRAVRQRHDAAGQDLAPWGLLTGWQRHDAALEALDAVVDPCRDALGLAA